MLNPFDAELPYLLQGSNPIIFALIFGCIYGFRQYMKGPRCLSDTKLKSKLALITGGSGDIAYSLAKDLLQRDCQVVLACRDTEKGDAAVADIRQKVKGGTLVVMHLDLASLQSVREFAKQFQKKYDKLDLLINNAGLMLTPFTKTVDGVEEHFQVNYLSHFLLTHLLLDTLKAAGQARVINLSAVAHFAGSMSFDDINRETVPYEARECYSQSKLALVMFTRFMVNRLEGTGVCIFAVHPGICDTDHFRHTPLGNSTLFKVLSYPFVFMLMKNGEDGAQTVLHCALTPDLGSKSGSYFSDCREKAPSEASQDEENQQKLYDLSLKLCGLGKGE